MGNYYILSYLLRIEDILFSFYWGLLGFSRLFVLIIGEFEKWESKLKKSSKTLKLWTKWKGCKI